MSRKSIPDEVMNQRFMLTTSKGVELRTGSILILTSAYRPFIGGSEAAIEDIIREMPEFFFVILTPRFIRTLPSFESDRNFAINRLGLGIKLDKYLFPILGFIRGIWLVRQNNIRIVHSFQGSYGGLAGFLIKKYFSRIKFIVTLQEGKDVYRQPVIVKFLRAVILKNANIITAISNWLSEYAFQTIRPNSKMICLIPNGVDLNLMNNIFGKRDKLRKTYGWGQDDKVIVTVSRLVEKNNIGRLVESMVKIVKNVTSVKLVIVGSGEMEKKLQKKCSQLGLEKSVIFTGALNRIQALEMVAASDVFVRPSLTEGFGTAFIEAMALRTVVVASYVGGIRDFLIDGKTGLICNPVDSKDIADKIIKIMKDHELRNLLVRNGLELVQKRYDIKRIASKYAKLYNLYLND